MKTQKYQRLLERLHGRFERLYPGHADRCIQRLEMMLGRYGIDYDSERSPYQHSHKDLFLITYGDTLRSEAEKPLHTLKGFLNQNLKDCINTVHVLPFSPYSSDDGFSVIDYRKVNPELGTWDEIKAIASDFRLMSDLVINHVSRESRWFQDYAFGLLPEKKYFLELDPSTDLSDVVRPRSLPLLTPVHTRDGLRHVWTTFSDDQIDLDFSNPDVFFEFLDIIMLYVKNGVRVIRLDAIAYLWKKVGTSCIHLPETHEVVKALRDFLEIISPETTLITETNVPHDENVSYFGAGEEAHMVYQFPLPPLLLHAMLSGNCRYLTEWADGLSEAELPEGCTFLNFTASHDGIGLRPLEGIVPEEEIRQLIESVRRRGGEVSTRTTGEGNEKPYELNITYFDAVSDPDSGDTELDINRFICSQAIALCLKGVPAVYIHSLLGTRNDYLAVEQTGQPRSINRSTLEIDKLEQELGDHDSTRGKVFRRYKRLMHSRTQHVAFSPESHQKVLDLAPEVFAVERTDPAGRESVLCLHNLNDKAASVTLPETCGRGPWRDIISGKLYGNPQNKLKLSPFHPLWLDTADVTWPT